MKIIKRILLGCLVLFLTACSSNNQDDNTMKIAQQYGLAYAPIQIMKDKGFLEQELPSKNIEWVKLANTAAIREAVLADNLDVGFMGIPPFLIALDNGMEWKMMAGLSQSPLGLVTYDTNIRRLSDIKEDDKIALPQPGSIQHILLAMACEKQLGSADIFDKQLVSMKHPDGYQALLSKSDIKAHFTSPPYLFEELNNDENHMVISGEEALGKPFTFIVGVGTEKFYTNHKDEYKALQVALEKSIDFIQEQKEETIKLLSEAYDIEPEKLEEYLYHNGMIYSKDILGVGEFIDFMVRNDYLKKSYSIEEVMWE